MKVICHDIICDSDSPTIFGKCGESWVEYLKNSYHEYLKIGQIYEVISETEFSYTIDAGPNIMNFFDKRCFVEISEWRENRLNKLGINIDDKG